jgi:hypothetical protein
MAKRGKRAAKTNTPTERDLAMLWNLKRRAGSRAALIRWLTDHPEPKREERKRGRPKNDFFTDFSVSEGPAKGLYLVCFKIGGAAPLVWVAVSPKKRWVKEFRSGKKIEILTPHQTFHEIVKRLWELPEVVERDTDLTPAERDAWKLEATKLRLRLGNEVDSVTRRLTSEFRQKLKLLK